MTTGFNLKSREKKAVQQSVDRAMCLCQSLQEELADEKPQPEFLLDKETKVRNGYNPKLQMARVPNIIVKFARWDFEHIRQKTKGVNDDLIRILGSMQEFLKKTDINDCTPELLGKYANLEELISRLASIRRSWNYRIQFTGVVLRLLCPFAENEKGRTTPSRACEFLLGSRLIKPTIRERRRCRQRPGSYAPACRSAWRYA